MSDNSEYLPGAEEAVPEVETQLPAVVPSRVSPVAAKDAGVANFLASAYSKAGTLRLTPEESAALMADFPDDAFRTGAAGNDRLIYIEHPAIKKRLDTVLGMGQWTPVPIRFWTEEYKTKAGRHATRVYCEGVLIIRGVYVAQAVGDMAYYPDNDMTNYGDAYTGAQTAFLRRCCEDFGIGSQAWSKTFCEGWFERRLANGNNPPKPPATRPPKPAPTPPPPEKPEVHKVATATTRAYVLDEFDAEEGGAGRDVLTRYLRKLGWLDEDKEIEQWPLNTVPFSRKEIDKFKLCLGQFQANPEKVITPYPPHSTGAEPTPTPAQKTSSWANHIVPAGKHKGKPLHRVPTEDIKHLWSTNQFTDADLESQELPPEVIETMKRLREALALAAAELGFTRKETV